MLVSAVGSLRQNQNAASLNSSDSIRVQGISFSKMPTVRNARSLVTSTELPSGVQI